MREVRSAVKIIVLAIIPAHKNDGQCSNDLWLVEIGRLHPVDIREISCNFRPRACFSIELSLHLLRKIEKHAVIVSTSATGDYRVGPLAVGELVRADEICEP